MTRGVLLRDIGLGKIIWIGEFPAHYVRQMHLNVAEARPNVMHFIYLDNGTSLRERSYERGELPSANSVLKTNYPVRQFLRTLQELRPKALIITGYNRRLLVAALLYSRWKRVSICFWCDINLLILLNQNPLICLIKRPILKLLFAHAYKLLYLGTRNRDFYIWLLGLRLAMDKLFSLPYPALRATRITLAPPELENISQCSKTLNLLYLGRLEPIKAIHKLLQALAVLPEAIRYHVHLHVYGGGSEESRLKAIAIKFAISELVTFHGPVSSDQVASAYASADLFVLPSDKEPWGIVVNEALLSDVPVMCPFWVGAAIDLITDGETGYILENNTPECIAAGIERAYQAGPSNKLSGIRGRNRVITGGWNVESASARLVNLLDDISRKAHEYS